MATVTLCFSSLREPELTALLYILSHEQKIAEQPASLARVHEQEHNAGRAGACVHKMGQGFQVTTYPLTPASAMVVAAKFEDWLVTER